MQKEVYADNVDVNGEVHETVGENIRNGAKSPEAVAKALQSEDITFDMQALMNVLPFMDSTKKIVKVTIKNGAIIEGNDVANFEGRRVIPLVKWYGVINGEYEGVSRQAAVIFQPNGSVTYDADYSTSTFVFYVAVKK